MTLIIGARCKDGVAMVADRRMVRVGGMEVQEPERKLRQIGKVAIGRVGISAVMDAMEKFLKDALSEGKAVISAWDVTTVAEEVAERYKALEADSRPFFPVIDLANGQARLYQVAGGAPPGEMTYQSWGIGESYANIGRIFAWRDIPVNQAWHIMTILVAITARISSGVGGGIDAVLVRDDGDIEFVDEATTSEALKKSEALADQLLNVIMEESKVSLKS